MRHLKFIKGGVIREVFINGRLVKIITPELNFAPFEIDLDKLDLNDSRFQGMEDLLTEISKLNSEEEIEKDFENDWKESGWRKM